jgi:hypothetical protein
MIHAPGAGHRSGNWLWYRLLGVSAFERNVLLLPMVVVLGPLLALLIP